MALLFSFQVARGVFAEETSQKLRTPWYLPTTACCLLCQVDDTDMLVSLSRTYKAFQEPHSETFVLRVEGIANKAFEQTDASHRSDIILSSKTLVENSRRETQRNNRRDNDVVLNIQD